MSCKIYFAGSICGGRDDAALYMRMVEELKTYGHVFTEHVATVEKEEFNKDDKTIHDQDMEWLNESDVLVAECTQASLGVGYEIGRAVTLGKKILILFRPDSGRKLSAMIRGAEDGISLICKDYKGDEFKVILKDFFASL